MPSHLSGRKNTNGKSNNHNDFLSWYGNGKRMDEELTTEELMDLRVILVRFMADKEAHKKIPLLESRAPKLWDKVDRMYQYKQKGNEDRS